MKILELPFDVRWADIDTGGCQRSCRLDLFNIAPA